MSDPEISKYNMCKKLSQLHKVIQYLLVNLDEQRFQVEILSKDYQSNERTIFDNYEQNATRIINNINVGLNIDSVHKSFYRKYDILKTGFNHVFNESNKEFDSWENSIQQAIGAIIAEITEINEEIKSQSNNINEKFSKFNTELQQNIKNASFQSRKELAAIDKDNRTRYAQLQSESEEKINNLMKSFEEKKKGEETKIRASTPLPNMGRRSSKSQKERIYNIREAASSLKKSISATENTNKNNFVGFHSRVRAMIDQMNELKENNQKEVENFHNIIENLESELQQEKSTAELEKEELAKVHEKEVKDLEKELENEEKSYKSEYEHLSRLYDKDIFGQSSETDSIRQKFSPEALDLQNNQKQEISLLNTSINDLMTELSIFKERADDIIAKLVRKQAEMANSFDDIVKETKDRYDNDISEYKKELEEEMASKKFQIENNKSIKSKSQNSEIEIKKYKATLSGLIGAYHAKIGTLKETEDAEIYKLKSSFETNFQTESKKLDAEYGSMKAKSDINFEIASQKIQREFLDFQSKLNSESSKNLDMFDDNFDEINKIEEKYQNEFDELKKEYVKIMQVSPPRSEISVVNHYNFLLAEKSKKNEAIKLEREEMIADFKREYDSLTNTRPRTSSSDNVEHRIGQAKIKMMSKLVQYDNTIASMLIDLKKQKQRALDIAITSDDPNTDSLKAHLQNLQEESSETINKRKEIVDSEIRALQAELYTEIETQKTESAKLTAKYESEIVILRSEEQKLIEKKVNSQRAFDIKYKSFIEVAKKQMEELLKSITDLKTGRVNKIENASQKAKLEADKQNLYIIENEKRLEKQLKEETLRIMKEKEKLSNNHKKYESPEIDEAQRKLDEAKKKMSLRGPRSEEQDQIEKLTQALHAKNQYLIMVGRDMLDYRSRLIEQEQEVDARFGYEPLVSIGSQAYNIKRPLTAVSTLKKLPRLPAPNIE
ncbi:hypothetical protein TVAG_059660 [Trichomonas vaginalis G3]|uniref:Uncharacterized protein n=1 Tax=Trichomonas vaginalis (strain ATCC PRA-98 / G3) TaxID=412133 RepID=A2FB18_TRIV3|nr:TAG-278-related family [Trichomonas vaginalis G3]EAX97901.1 hypothetical protein TVAG_059660 [Trichomonas vaginalis G3]KAI5509852.1 TAG-278-related family [Trichomonas vaginalis G3]|eukprot:XP_001310831.1 hypothetical protein [Trichomonas vaginalis G3]